MRRGVNTKGRRVEDQAALRKIKEEETTHLFTLNHKMDLQ